MSQPESLMGCELYHMLSSATINTGSQMEVNLHCTAFLTFAHWDFSMKCSRVNNKRSERFQTSLPCRDKGAAFLANTAYEFVNVNVSEILFHFQIIFFRGYAL